jgi:hypothetical protein
LSPVTGCYTCGAPEAMRPAREHAASRMLLAATTGALLAAGFSLATAADLPASGSLTASAVVLTSAGCVGGGQDTVAVSTASSTVDACGQPVGRTVSVRLAPDGSVGPLVVLASTRGAREPSPMPAVILGIGAAVTAGLGAITLRTRRGR